MTNSYIKAQRSAPDATLTDVVKAIEANTATLAALLQQLIDGFTQQAPDAEDIEILSSTGRGWGLPNDR